MPDSIHFQNRCECKRRLLVLTRLLDSVSKVMFPTRFSFPCAPVCRAVEVQRPPLFSQPARGASVGSFLNAAKPVGIGKEGLEQTTRFIYAGNVAASLRRRVQEKVALSMRTKKERERESEEKKSRQMEKGKERKGSGAEAAASFPQPCFRRKLDFQCRPCLACPWRLARWCRRRRR